MTVTVTGVPAVAVPGAVTVKWVAVAGPTVVVAVVPVRSVELTARVYTPAFVRVRALKVATPLEAFTVVVPPRVPPVGPCVMATVTVAAEGAVLP